MIYTLQRLNVFLDYIISNLAHFFKVKLGFIENYLFYIAFNIPYNFPGDIFFSSGFYAFQAGG